MKQAGFWRPHATDEISGLPWPVAGEPWEGQSAFLAKLAQVEGIASHVNYRGWSNCRLCGQPNGIATFTLGDWSWPSGYAHYLGAEHNVAPDPEFYDFVVAVAAIIDEVGALPMDEVRRIALGRVQI